jgi:hypothetical protein
MRSHPPSELLGDQQCRMLRTVLPLQRRENYVLTWNSFAVTGPSLEKEKNIDRLNSSWDHSSPFKIDSKIAID